MSQRLDGYHLREHWPLAALAFIYGCLAVILLVLSFQPPWFGVSVFMGLLTALSWWMRIQRPVASTSRSESRVAALLPTLTSLPTIYLALPLPLMASWFAGDIALGDPAHTNYWQAFGLWLGGIALFVAILVPWNQLWEQRNIAAVWASVPWLEVGAVLLLTLVAFGARAVDLVDEPNPFSGDEANFGLQALEVDEGVRRNMFATGVPFGQPSMYYFLVSLSNKIFGVGVLATRAPSVFFGVTMVPVTYLLLRELFDRRVALVGAAFLAIYHLHIHFSRVGLNNMSAAWIAVVTLYFAARATRTQKPLDFGLAGGAAGLCLYSFVAARVVPVVLGLYFGWVVLRNWRFLFANFGNFLVLLAGFAVVAAPQGLFFIHVPDEFYAGHRWANIFASGWLKQEEQIRGTGAYPILVDQVRDAFAVLVVKAEVYHHYNPGQPLVDGISRWPFILGGVLSLVHIRQPRYLMLLALLILTVILGAALDFPPPSSARLVTITPAVAGLVAIGVVAAVDFITRLHERLAELATPLMVGGVALMAFVNIQFYFGYYLPNDRYVVGDNDVTFAVGRYMEDLGPDYIGYWFGLPRIYTGDPTMRFIGRHRIYVEVPAGAKRLPPVANAEPNATFMFLPEREKESIPIREACPGGEWKEFWENHDKRVLFYAYELPNGQACVRSAHLALTAPEPVEQPPAVITGAPGTAAERDEQRRNDLEAISQALEQYYDDKGSYPDTGGQVQTLCAYLEIDAGCSIRDYLDPIPTDPAGEPLVDGYWYASDGARFSIFALQEVTIDPTATDCPFYSKTALGAKQIGLCVSGAR